MSATMRADCSCRTSSHAFASTSRTLSFRPQRLTRPQRAKAQQARAAGNCRSIFVVHAPFGAASYQVIGSGATVCDQQTSTLYSRRSSIQCETYLAGSDDTDFDKRLDALKKGKGPQGYTKRRQEKATQQGPSQSSAKKGAMATSTSCELLHSRWLHAE